MKGGLFTDTSAQGQPQGSYRFALNMISQTNGISLMSQPGNTAVTNLGDTLVGSIALDGQQIILFTAPGSIHLFDGESLTLLYSDSAFAFDRRHPITGKFRTVNGCERVIYWCDGVNPDRYFNIDRPERFTSIDDFSFVPTIDYPTVTTQVESGGDLDYGSYRFVVEILDATENVILRTEPTPPVAIGSALNDGRDSTNERIRLTITSLDTDFTTLRVGVIRFVSGDGLTPTAHYIGDPVQINDLTVEVLYEGYRPDAGESLIDFQTLFTPIVNYRTSHSMTTIHGRLQRYNLKEQVYDYSLFQQAASKIVTSYVVETVDRDDLMDRRTEQGDEVRDFGIVYVTKYGTLSPRFHIPGRAKNTTDSVLTTGALIGIDGSVEQWRVQNTSPGGGVMAYYESEETYNNPINFNDDDYWGTDADGNSLLGQPVRYHRLPDRSVEPLVDSDGKARFLGVKFSNIEYPHEDIIGHFITDNVPNVSSRTVTAAGYCIPFNDTPDSFGDKIEGRYIHYLNNAINDLERQSNSVGQHFINTLHLVDGTPAQGDYVRFMGRPNYDYEDYRPVFYAMRDDEDETALYGKHHAFGGHEDIVFEQFGLVNSVNIAPMASQGNYTNKSKSSTFNVLTLDQEPASYDEVSPNTTYAYVKRNVTPFPSHNGVRHRVFSTINYDAADTTVFNGHAFIVNLFVTNISHLSFPGGDNLGIEYEYIRGLTMESYYDLNRRYNGTIDCDKVATINEESVSFSIYANYPGEDPSGVFLQRVISTIDLPAAILLKVLRKEGSGDKGSWVLREGVCREFYGYNKDYNPGEYALKEALPYNYDYDSKCLGEYPVKIAWSEAAADEEFIDAWRVHKPLNTVDIPADRGQIIRADVHNNQIVVRCHNGCYILRPNPQEMQLTDTTAYLGTGGFLSIPAQGLDFSDTGYGGQQSVLGSVVTPAGLFWADEVTGKVFRFTDTISEVSRNGMYHFFEEHLRKGRNHEYGLLGALMYYDPTYEMIYLTSTEYTPRKASVLGADGFHYYQDRKVSYTDKSLFENRGFTISFDARADVWRSFHSFRPSYAFHLSNGFFSTIRRDDLIFDAYLYSHDDDDRFAHFYNLDYPVSLQVTHLAENGMTVRWQGAHYYATVEEKNGSSWKVVRNDTFDQAIAFTDQQSTGLIGLRLTRNPSEQVAWSSSVKNVVEADQNYRVSSLRDMSTAEPVMTDAWDSLSAFYDNYGQGYIDAVPVNIDLNIPQYDQVYLRDKFVHLRLFYTNSARRIVAHYVFIRSLPTLR